MKSRSLPYESGQDDSPRIEHRRMRFCRLGAFDAPLRMTLSPASVPRSWITSTSRPLRIRPEFVPGILTPVSASRSIRSPAPPRNPPAPMPLCNVSGLLIPGIYPARPRTYSPHRNRFFRNEPNFPNSRHPQRHTALRRSSRPAKKHIFETNPYLPLFPSPAAPNKPIANPSPVMMRFPL
jgi:hypothetical protein